MTDARIAEEIRKEFPKHNKAVYSMAKRTHETGVMLCPRANEIKAQLLKRKRDGHKLKNRLSVRVSPELYAEIMAVLAEKKMTANDWLAELIDDWMRRNHEAD